MNRLDDMNSWRMFCEIVRAEGLNAACERLDCEPSTASRAIHALEKELGAPLFSRSSRPVKLTQLGHEAYQAALKLTATHEDMIRSLKGDKSKLSGLIWVTSHADIGPAEITPALVEFQKIYPDIQFELSELTAPLPDGFMTSDGNLVDVAVGYGEDAPLPGVIQRYSGEMPFIPCASPAYVKKHGFPRQVDDCQRHTGVLINTPTRSATTVLQKGAKTATIRWKSTLIVHNLISVKSAVMLGAGVVPDLPLYHCADDIEAGNLVAVLDGWRRKPLSCFVYAREESYEKRRVQVFVDWLADHEERSMNRLKSRFPEFYH